MVSHRNAQVSKPWLDYRAAFETFSASVRNLQCLAAQEKIDGAAIEAALLEVESARVAHNACRDTLARELLRRSERSLPRDGDRAAGERNRVKAIAELLWEMTGRPEGSAENNWHRAEDIVRRTPPLSACC